MANEGWPTPAVDPTLAYADVPAAIEWLTNAFGFRERRDARLTGHGFPGCLDGRRGQA
jgi:hypothetical protein